MFSPRKNKMTAILIGIILVIGLISLSCNLPAGLQERFFGPKGTLIPTPAPTNTPQPLPPTIVESDPPAGSTIPLQSEIVLYFNQAMKQDSVINALSSDPALETSYSWIDPSTLKLSFDQNWHLIQTSN